MKNTMNTIKTMVNDLNTTCTKATKDEREKSFVTFTTDTFTELSPIMTLTTKESNTLTSCYGVLNAFADEMREEKLLATCDGVDENVMNAWSKIVRHAVSSVASSLKKLDDCIYSTYEPLKNNDVDAFANAYYDLVKVPVTDNFFKFMRAYMFTVDKQLSKKAYVKKFVALLTALKEHQGNYSLKYEKVTLKNVFKDLKVTTIDPKSVTTYEDLKAFVADSSFKAELCNNDMIKDTKVFNKAKKEMLVLTAEEYEVYEEIMQSFKK